MSDQSARIRTVSIADATATWFPEAVSLSGTLSSADKRVTGTSTTFTSQINEGDFLINASNIARKVVRIMSDTELYLESPFSSDLSSASCKRVKNQVLRHLKVVFITNNGTLKTASQDTPAAWPASTPWESPSTLSAYLEPILVTPGAAGASIAETI